MTMASDMSRRMAASSTWASREGRYPKPYADNEVIWARSVDVATLPVEAAVAMTLAKAAAKAWPSAVPRKASPGPVPKEVSVRSTGLTYEPPWVMYSVKPAPAARVLFPVLPNVVRKAVSASLRAGKLLAL